MGLFVEREANATSIEAALARAFEAPERSTAEAKQVAAAEAPVLAQSAAAATKHCKLGKIVFAVSCFLIVLAVAIAAKAPDWVDDRAKVYDFAGLVLAVVIGTSEASPPRNRRSEAGAALGEWEQAAAGRCPVAGYGPTGSFFRVTTHLPRNDA